METVELEEYQFPEGIGFKDYGAGCIAVPVIADTGYLKCSVYTITDGKFESTFEVSFLGEPLSPLRVLKSELDNALDTFLRGRAELETKWTD